ncbi:MAG TPA: hypothetical protein VIM98_01755 [Dyella sp.]|uniref:hypothetical protein n=1 Tax=Dyella sp. TaxID=1869338 RepID=UPI002F93158E
MATYFSRGENLDSDDMPPSGIETIVVTDPDQFVVSSRTETARGTLVFSLSRHHEQTQNVFFHKLVIAIPTGIGATDLTATPVALNTLAGESTGRAMNVVADLQNRDRAIFTVTAADGNPIQLNPAPNKNVISITFALIEINTEPGRVNIDYDPWTSVNGAGQGTQHNEVITVFKTNSAFFLRNLRPERMMIQSGDNARVFWESSAIGTRLFLQRDTEPEFEVYGAAATLNNVYFHTAVRLRAETTFAGEPIEHYQTTVILVNQIFDIKSRLSPDVEFVAMRNSFFYASIVEGTVTLRTVSFNPPETTVLPLGVHFLPLRENERYIFSGLVNIYNIYQIWSTEALNRHRQPESSLPTKPVDND